MGPRNCMEAMENRIFCVSLKLNPDYTVVERTAFSIQRVLLAHSLRQTRYCLTFDIILTTRTSSLILCHVSRRMIRDCVCVCVCVRVCVCACVRVCVHLVPTAQILLTVTELIVTEFVWVLYFDDFHAYPNVGCEILLLLPYLF
jgi:hypothetical protein